MTHDALLDRLQAALDHDGGTHTLADVAEAIDNGDAQLWRGEGAVVVTEVLKAPRTRTCRIWLAAGEKGGVSSAVERIEQWATDSGCDRMEAVGRKGWKRTDEASEWKQRGWKHAACVYRREL